VRREFALEPRAVLPPLADGAVRVIPVSGVEEIGRNMIMVEYKNYRKSA
jgi:mRNA degradation ribonuclease J1/J2